MPQNAKKKNFSRRFSIAILRKSSSCMTSYQDAFVSFAFYYDSIRSYVIVYVLRTYFYVYRYAYVLLRDRLSTFNTQQAVWLCFPGMTSSLAKSKQIIGAHFQTLFSTIFLVFDVPQHSNRFAYIKDIRPAIYFNNQKIIAYHL